MSHRVTTRTDMKNPAAIRSALQKSNFSFTEESSGDFRVTSGPMSGATINPKTGVVTGDTDRHNKNTLGMLKQVYGEVVYMTEAQKNGIELVSRRVDAKTGDIVLRMQMFG